MSKWTSNGFGSLKVLPVLKESIGYWLLRPLLSDIPKNEFPGCLPWQQSLHITPRWHSDMFNGMIDLPDLEPGDSVWMHPDMVRMSLAITDI